MNKRSYIVLGATVIYLILIVTFLALERDPYKDFSNFDECDYLESCINVCHSKSEPYSDEFLKENFPYDKFIEIDNDTKFIEFGIHCSNLETVVYMDNKRSKEWEFSYDGGVEYDGVYIKHSKYCMDPSNNWSMQTCVTNHTFLKLMHYLLLFMAIAFMLIPLVIFISFPELRDYHGMMCVALLTSQVFILGVLPFNKASDLFSNHVSFIVVIVLYVGAFSSNFCINAMCFDIYLTFKHFREPYYQSKYFKIVCIIIGCVILFMVFALSIQKFEIGDLFVLMITILIMSYFIFFLIILLDLFILIATLFYMAQIERSSDTSENTRYDLEKERYWVYVRIFAVVLIMWTIEMMTWSMHNSYESEVIADAIKALSAGIIAYLLMWKSKIYNLIFEKYKSFGNDVEGV